MEGDSAATGQTLDMLLGPIGEQHLDFLSAKWQIQRYEWRTGDDLPEPLDVPTLADQMGMTETEALDEDGKMVATFGPAVYKDPNLIKVQFAGVPVKDAWNWWEENINHQ